MKLLRKILYPFVPIYFAVTWLRNWLYDLGLKKSKSYDFPLVCVGNLTVGGTGKTPMIEFLLRHFGKDYKLATLSRGYGRQTKGFVLADRNATAFTIGDEPYQFYRKFNSVIVAVDADRKHGISKLRCTHEPDIILLDDAFQHRKVKAGLTILLTDYSHLYCNDIVLPTGNLREPRVGANRADIVVVTKCPTEISEENKQKIISELQPTSKQVVFFSWIDYDQKLYNGSNTQYLEEFLNDSITVVTGIANPDPFIAYLKQKNMVFEHLKFKDHHVFSAEEILLLKQKSKIITTEKDFVRLKPHFQSEQEKDVLWYLPIQFIMDNAEDFTDKVEKFISRY